MTTNLREPGHGQGAMPKGVWVLGFVSLLMDISSEMIHSLLPVYLVTVLGASALLVGLIEGVAESTTMVVKVFSGALSDSLGKRKALAVFGYGLGAVSKPFFAIAGSPGMVFGARFVDRIGKGIRGAPRDALVADLVRPEARGAAYGLRQSLDTVGAFSGPLLAVGLMLLWANDFQAVFWVAVIPAVLAVILLFFGISEPESPGHSRVRKPIDWRAFRSLHADYWWVVGIGGAFALARFSEAFLVLRVQQTGLSVAWAPLVLIAMNLVFAVSAYPFGKLSDRVSHTRLLFLGLAILIAADLFLALGDTWQTLLPGILLWGLHMGMTQGLLATMVAATAPAGLRGTAFGIFSLISGITTLVASVLAGWLWDSQGVAFPFYAGAVFAAAAMVLMVIKKENSNARAVG